MKVTKKWICALVLLLLAAACKPEPPAKQSNKPDAAKPAAQPQQQSRAAPAEQQPAEQPIQEPDSYPPPATGDRAVAQAQQAPPGPHAVMYGQFGSKDQAEDNIRTLRANRVNCFIHETPAGQYCVLVGPFRNHGEASKQMNRLQERGIQNLSLYRMPN